MNAGSAAYKLIFGDGTILTVKTSKLPAWTLLIFATLSCSEVKITNNTYNGNTTKITVSQLPFGLDTSLTWET